MSRKLKSVTLRNLKEELKVLAQTLKTTKPTYRQAYSEAARKIGSWSAVSAHRAVVGQASNEFRCKHVAYCMLRGRTLAQIENTKRCENEKCYCCNRPDLKRVEALLAEYRKALDTEAAEVPRGVA